MDERTARLLVETEWLHGLTRRLVADPELAADVAQETMLVAWRRRLHEVVDVRSWLATVAHNFARRLGRKARRRTQVEAATQPAEDHAPAVDDVVQKAEAQRTVVDAVLRLREPYRTTVLLHHLESMTLPAIAAQQAEPLETVRARLRRGMQQLRRELDAETGGEPRWALPILGIAGFREALAARAGDGAAGAALAGSTATAGVLLMTTSKWTLAMAGTVAMAWVALQWIGPAATPPTIPGPTTTLAARSSEPSAPVDVPAALARDTAPAAAGTAAKPDPADGFLLRGSVVDREHGGAVAAARLELLAEDSPLEPTPAVLASAISGPDGTFTLPATTIAPGQRLRVDSAPHALLVLTVAKEATAGLGERGTVDVGRIELNRGTRLAGSVRDDRGAPVAAARLFAFEAQAGGGIQALARAVALTASDGDGRFTLPRPFAPQANEQWLLAIGAHGLGYRPIDAAALAAERRDFDVVLQPTMPLTTTCVDEHGQPLAGVAVQLWPAFAPLSGMLDIARTARAPQLASHLLIARSDARGVATFPHVPVGGAAVPSMPTQTGREYQLVAAVAGHRGIDRTLPLPRDGQLALVLAHGTVVTVRGQVVDERGAAIAGATVAIGNHAPLAADAQGTFTRTRVDVARGRLVLTSRAPGFQPRTEILDVSGRGGDVEHQVVLPRSTRCSGVVVDQFGAVVAGARIWFQKQLTNTDAAGRWAFDVADGAEGPLVVWPPEDGAAWATMTTVQLGVGEHRIVHPRLGAVAGLRLELRDRDSGRLLEPKSAGAYLLDDRDEYRKLGGDGARIVANNLSVGRWRVHVLTRDGRAGVREFDLAAGMPAVAERWELAPAASVRVTVRGPWTGALPEDVTVQWDPAGPGAASADAGTARGDHAFTLPAGSPGALRLDHVLGDRPLRLCASSASFAGTATVEVLPGGDHDVVFTLAAAGTVELRAADRPGVLASEVTFTCVGAAWRWTHWQPRPDGASTARFALPTGDYEYRVVTRVPGTSNEIATGRLRIEPGTTTPLRLR